MYVFCLWHMVLYVCTYVLLDCATETLYYALSGTKGQYSVHNQHKCTLLYCTYISIRTCLLPICVHMYVRTCVCAWHDTYLNSICMHTYSVYVCMHIRMCCICPNRSPSLLPSGRFWAGLYSSPASML